ncbi:MAG: polysaccharide deacetylase family protein [Proteobacteria bacterium]|nr:polysaccharide deacetylase family protein [Pseudomonadota bacterium]
MCRLCPPRGPRLSRRAFGGGLLAAAVQPVLPECLRPAGTGLLEPALRLAVQAGAPRTVALTLDACGGQTDHRILDQLLALSVPATIFATGLWLAANPQTVALLRSRPDLFSLQNHGERHLPPVLGDRRVFGLPVAGTMEAVHREVQRGAGLIEATGAPRPRWYRGAAGLYSPDALAGIRAMGVWIAGYALNADAGASLPAAAVARRIAAARPGDVIVAHVNQPHRPSGAGVAEGIAALKQAGAAFVLLDAASTEPLDCPERAPHPSHKLVG